VGVPLLNRSPAGPKRTARAIDLRLRGSETERVNILLILGLICLVVGLGAFGAISVGLTSGGESALTPQSVPFLVGFMGSLGGVSLCALYLALKIWKWMYKRSA